MDKEALKEKIKAVIANKRKKAKTRKETEGRPNIENVSTPQKKKPAKVKEEKKKKHTPGMVSIGAHGGRYIQEASGHKRYVSEGQLAGTKKIKKSLEGDLSSDPVKGILEDIVKSGEIKEFVSRFKKEKKHE